VAAGSPVGAGRLLTRTQGHATLGPKGALTRGPGVRGPGPEGARSPGFGAEWLAPAPMCRDVRGAENAKHRDPVRSSPTPTPARTTATPTTPRKDEIAKAAVLGGHHHRPVRPTGFQPVSGPAAVPRLPQMQWSLPGCSGAPSRPSGCRGFNDRSFEGAAVDPRSGDPRADPCCRWWPTAAGRSRAPGRVGCCPCSPATCGSRRQHAPAGGAAPPTAVRRRTGQAATALFAHAARAAALPSSRRRTDPRF
jgi:hypothetical protein